MRLSPWCPVLLQRVRNSWAAASWIGRSGLLTLTLLAGLLTGLTFMTRSDEGVTRVLQYMAAGQSTRSSMDDWWASRIAPAPEDSASDALATALAPTVPTMDAWASRLSRGRLLDTPMTLWVRPWSSVSPQMQTLASGQGITLRSWPEKAARPSHLNRVHTASVFWVEQTSDKSWTVAGNPSDLLRSRTVDGSTLTDMDVVRLLLWSDNLPLVSQWHAAHPAPTTPPELVPPNISVQFIAGNMGAGVLFWNAVACLILLAGTAGALVALLGWDGVRREGLLEPLMALPIPDRRLVGVLWGSWAVWGSLVWLGALLIGTGVLISEKLPWSFHDLVTVAALVECSWLLGLALSLAILTLFPGRGWRLGGRLLIAFGLLLLEWNSYAALTGARSLAALLDSRWSWLIVNPSLLLVVGCLLLAGRRLSVRNRLGWRRV